MSYTYLQDAGAESSAASFSDIILFAPLKLNPTAARCSCNGSGTACCHDSQSGTTCEPSMADRGEGGLMSSAADSPAKTFQQPEKVQESAASEADCGPRCEGSLAKWNPGSCSWRTRQCSLFGGLVEFSETWPRWGMMRDGEFWALSTPERRTKENGYGFWPTPVKTDGFAVGWCKTSIERKERGETRPSGAHIGSGLKYFRKTGQYLSNGYPNPLLTEWLMGWPLSWTDLRPLETVKFREWLRSHGESFQTESRNDT